MRGRPPASPTARSTDPVTRRTSDGDRPVPSSVAALPPFSNQRGCLRCGARYEIRVHFDRDCAEVRGDHFHRVCPSGHRWVEPCSEGPMPTGSRLGGLNRRSEEHTSELQSPDHLVCRLLLEKKKRQEPKQHHCKPGKLR